MKGLLVKKLSIYFLLCSITLLSGNGHHVKPKPLKQKFLVNEEEVRLLAQKAERAAAEKVALEQQAKIRQEEELVLLKQREQQEERQLLIKQQEGKQLVLNQQQERQLLKEQQELNLQKRSKLVRSSSEGNLAQENVPHGSKRAISKGSPQNTISHALEEPFSEPAPVVRRRTKQSSSSRPASLFEQIEAPLLQDAKTVEWRDTLSPTEQLTLKKFTTSISKDSLGRTTPVGNFVKDVDSLVSKFSPENQLEEDYQIIKKGNNAVIGEYVGKGKQFSTVEEFVDALDKERSVVSEALEHADKTSAVGMVKQQEAYDRALNYIAKEQNVTPPSERIIKNSSVRTTPLMRPVETDPQKALRVQQLLQPHVQTVQQEIKQLTATLKSKLDATNKYKDLADDYAEKVANVEKLYEKLSNTPYDQVKQADVLEYQKAIGDAEKSYTALRSNSHAAQKAYDALSGSCEQIKRSINYGIATAEQSLPNNSADIKNAFQPLISTYNDAVKYGTDSNFKKDFFQSSSNDSIIVYKDLLNGLQHKAPVDKYTKFTKKFLKHLLKGLKLFIKAHTFANAQPESVDCQLFDYAYRQSSNVLAGVINEIEAIGEEINNQKKESNEAVLKNLSDRLKKVIVELNSLEAGVNAAASQKKSTLTVCVITARRMNSLAVPISNVRQAALRLQTNLKSLQESLDADSLAA